MEDGIPILRGSNDALRVLILQTDNARLQLLPLLSSVTHLLSSSDFTNSSGDSSFLTLQPHDEHPNRRMAYTNKLVPSTMEAN
jgi:hypothetical protein